MAEKKSKKKSNNKKNNTKKVETTKKVNTEKKEVKKITPNEEVKVEKVTEEKKIVKETVKKEKKQFKLTSSQRDIVLILLVAVVLVIALVLTGGKKIDIELPVALEGTPGFNEITYSEYAEKLDTEAPFVVVIVNEGCGYCEMFEPVVEEVANEYGLPISYLNLANLSAEERTALATSNSYLKRNQWGTPTTLFLYGKTVVDSIGGYVDKEKFVDFVKENFKIGE